MWVKKALLLLLLQLKLWSEERKQTPEDLRGLFLSGTKPSLTDSDR